MCQRMNIDAHCGTMRLHARRCNQRGASPMRFRPIRNNRACGTVPCGLGGRHPIRVAGHDDRHDRGNRRGLEARGAPPLQGQECTSGGEIPAMQFTVEQIRDGTVSACRAPNERFRSTIVANFFRTIFNRWVCQARASLMSEVPHGTRCQWIQNACNERIRSNRQQELKNFLPPEDAIRTAPRLGKPIVGIRVGAVVRPYQTSSDAAIAEIEFAVSKLLPNEGADADRHREALEKVRPAAAILAGPRAFRDTARQVRILRSLSPTSPSASPGSSAAPAGSRLRSGSLRQARGRRTVHRQAAPPKSCQPRFPSCTGDR